jgi:hypothetical protein
VFNSIIKNESALKKHFIGNGKLSIKTGLKCRGINELLQRYTLNPALRQKLLNNKAGTIKYRPGFFH